jgi:DNA-binding transcriptional LysR family regulator
MDLEELRAFLSVVETGSFLAAERALGMPRATVRRRVDALEARAGVPLLTKTRQGIVATEAGAVLASRGRMMIQEARALVSSVREIGQEPSGVLRVLVPVGLPPTALVPLFAAMRETYPRLAVRLHVSHDPVGGLLDDVDVALHFGAHSPPGPWVSHEILRLREWVVGRADYLALRGAPASLEDLAGHQLFAWEGPDNDPRRWPLRSGGALAVDPALVSPDVHLIRQCVLAGLGLALVPDGMLPDPGEEGAVVPVLPDLVGRDLALRLVVPSALTDLPRIKAVLRHVRAFTEQM